MLLLSMWQTSPTDSGSIGAFSCILVMRKPEKKDSFPMWLCLTVEMASNPELSGHKSCAPVPHQAASQDDLYWSDSFLLEQSKLGLFVQKGGILLQLPAAAEWLGARRQKERWPQEDPKAAVCLYVLHDSYLRNPHQAFFGALTCHSKLDHQKCHLILLG